ncbi:MAG TPA: hypothetical protein PK438_04910 [Clostridia bacterium]|nr:hypothetical protein [Clostridia bacterium]
MMQYRHCENGRFDDLACGKVLIGRAGSANFPVRLAQELFGRCLERLGRSTGLCVYDPCCGGGYMLAALGFLNPEKIAALAASDISPEAVALARDNLALLTRDGLEKRIARLEELCALYGKESHKEAAAAAKRLLGGLGADGIARRVFQADVLKPGALDGQGFRADVVVADVPYGSLASWQGGRESAGSLLDRLIPVLKEDSVVAICANKAQKFASPRFVRLEKQAVGKRAFAIYALAK